MAASPSIANTFGQDMFGMSTSASLALDSSSTLTRDLGVVQSAGARWVRVIIDWSSIQAAGPSSYDWTATDSMIERAEADGLSVLGTIVYTPVWDRPPGTTGRYGPSAASYAKFAAVAVQHYSALGVHAYEIWNEPNISDEWQPKPDPAAYTAVLKAAYTAIMQLGPGNTVISGSTAPAPTNGTSYSPVDFLSAIYSHGAKGYFDAVGHHPYCYPAYPGDAQTWSSWYQTYGTSPSLRSVMIVNGDGNKKIWGTEFGAPTNGPANSHYVSPATQAAMITKAYQLWSGYSWAGPLFIYEGRDESATDTSTAFNFMGLVDHNFNPKPSFAAYQKAVSTY